MQHVSSPFLFPGRSLLSLGSPRGYIDTQVETDGRVYLAETEVDEIVRVALECFPGLVEERVGVAGLRAEIDALTETEVRLLAELAEERASKVVRVDELGRWLREPSSPSAA